MNSRATAYRTAAAERDARRCSLMTGAITIAAYFPVVSMIIAISQ